MGLAPESTVGVRLLIALTVAVNVLVVFFPAVNSDAVVYALLSKNMVTSGDWVTLTFLGEDWLDKPHLPFWITALSFKVFGVQEFAYVLPGLVFHLLGGWFTYKLAKHFYGHATGFVAALMSLTAVRLLWSTTDVRAEVFLVAEIVAACYYWVRYDEEAKARFLLGGAVFTAMALMTKGPFVLVAIGGGLACDWIRRREWRNFIRPRWILALALSLVFVLPELIALYIQFDSHPEKVVFGRTGVSGIRWFFWDSQFGRFFNFGPIQNTHGHPFFFVHTFLWAFLPWTAFAVAAVVHFVRRRKQLPESERRPFVVLSMSFLLPFVLFSLTKFQLDHYIDILLPFAAILSARFLLRWLPEAPLWRALCRFQVQLSIVGALFVLGLCVLAFRDSGYLWTAALPIAFLTCVYLTRRAPLPARALVLPVLAVNVWFVFFALANRMYFVRYDAGYQLARYLDDQPRLPLYDYLARSKSLGFHAAQPYVNVDKLDRVGDLGRDAFVVAEDDRVEDVLRAFPGATVVARATGTRTNSVSKRLLSEVGWGAELKPLRLALVRTGGGTKR